MAINPGFRDMYTSAYSRKNSSRDILSKRYMDVISQINKAYSAADAEIDREYKAYANAASAQSAIAKKNTEDALVQKGLSRSGESVQSGILHDMALANTMTRLEEQKTNKIAQSNKNRMLEIASVQKQLADAEMKADSEERELEYRRERDKVSDEKWREEMDYNASRANVSDYKWEKEQEREKQRDAESDRRWNVSHAYQREQDALENDRKEREAARKNYENDRDYQLARDKYESERLLDLEELEMKKTAAANDNYIKNQYLALEKQALEKEKAHGDKSETTDENGITYTADGDGYYTPKMSANELLNLIERKSQYGLWSETEGYIGPRKLLKKRFLEILENPNLNQKYREDLLFLATARGIMED